MVSNLWLILSDWSSDFGSWKRTSHRIFPCISERNSTESDGQSPLVIRFHKTCSKPIHPRSEVILLHRCTLFVDAGISNVVWKNSWSAQPWSIQVWTTLSESRTGKHSNYHITIHNNIRLLGWVKKLFTLKKNFLFIET